MRQRTMIVGAVAAGLLLVACGAESDQEAAGVVTIDEPVAEEPDADEPDESDDAPVPDDAEADDPEADADTDVNSAEEPAAEAPAPDAERLADPCAEHEGREADAFIDLVAPVDEQVATGSVEIVGCSNVFEANVVWTLLDGDGVTLDEGFTTAECGTGCVGAFSDTVPLDTAEGEPVAYLQVFSPNPADEGPEQLELTEVILVLG